jgi:hypothetical protein
VEDRSIGDWGDGSATDVDTDVVETPAGALR